ncbi:ATP-binding protein [Flavobacterium sp.]|uniref:tetratricopeptide repeat-containing sensor histidine kinase n=1 Tax=Flavobacterium sp. TaxID=239 RepID=UPI00286CF5FD|nr:ATP-binding protein [Flavobacterium sp.]
MKNLFGVIFLILISLFGCSKSKSIADYTTKDSVAIYMQKAESLKTPYQLRIMYTKKAMESLVQQENDSLNRDKLINIAHNFYVLNSWKDLKITSEIELVKSVEKKDDYFMGQSYRWLGIYYENISANDSAFYFYLKAEKIFKKINNKKYLGLIYHDKAQVQFYSNDYLNQELFLIKALKIANELEDITEQYRINIDLGVSSNEQGDFKKAFYYYEKALILSKDKRNTINHSSAYCLNNIGINYLDTKNIKKAIELYLIALKEKNLEFESPIIFCRLIDNLGNAKLKLKDYNGIYNLHNKASKIYNRINNKQGINANKLFLSEYYGEIKDTINAKKYAHQAYSLSKNFFLANDVLLCLKQLSKVDTKNALKYSQEYIKISDSMQQLERVTRNKFAKIAYETEEITTEKDQAIKQKWVFFGIALLILLIGILLFVIIHQRNKQKELRFLQTQQKTNEEIYQLIQNQQTKIDEVRQIEKKRIAQDLHDGIMNRLASTRLNLHIIAEKPSPEAIKKCLPFIDGIQDIEKEIRNIAHDLNSNVLANKTSFIAVIETFIEEQKRISNRNYHLEIDMSINWEMLAGFKKIHLFRILQEAVQNIEKHAQAKNVIVSILKKDNHLLLEIFDDGNGFSLNRKKKGIGLQNIFSRAKSCEGSAEIKSKVNEGTTVIVRIPI